MAHDRSSLAGFLSSPHGFGSLPGAPRADLQASGRAGSWPPGPLARIDLSLDPESFALEAAAFKAHGSPWAIGACEALCQWAESHAQEVRSRLDRQLPKPPAEFARWLAGPESGLSRLWAAAAEGALRQPGAGSERSVDGLIALEALSMALRDWAGLIATAARPAD